MINAHLKDSDHILNVFCLTFPNPQNTVFSLKEDYKTEYLLLRGLTQYLFIYFLHFVWKISRIINQS